MGKLGTTRNGETWFSGKTDIWEANRPHCLPRGTHAPFRTGCGALAPALAQRCFTLSSVPVSISLPVPASLRSGAVSLRPTFFHRLSSWK